MEGEKYHEGRQELDRDVNPNNEPYDGVSGFEADESTLKPGYFTSSFFLGSMTAICLGLFAGVSGFAYAAPILTIGTYSRSWILTFR